MKTHKQVVDQLLNEQTGELNDLHALLEGHKKKLSKLRRNSFQKRAEISRHMDHTREIIGMKAREVAMLMNLQPHLDEYAEIKKQIDELAGRKRKLLPSVSLQSLIEAKLHHGL